MLFFDKPLNHGAGRSTPATLSDNSWDTVAAGRVFTLHVDTDGDGTGTARKFTHLFIKFAGEPQSFVITGVSFTFEPSTTVTDAYANTLTAKSDGFTNDLLDLVSIGVGAQTMQSVVLTFSADVEIAEILVLNAVLDFTGVEWNALTNYNDIQEIPLGQNRPNATGRLRYIPPLNNERDKWQVPCDILFTRQHEAMFDAYTAFRRTHREGFTFALDPVFFPHIIGVANFSTPTQTQYPARWKRVGRRVRFTIREQ